MEEQVGELLLIVCLGFGSSGKTKKVAEDLKNAMGLPASRGINRLRPVNVMLAV